VGLSGSGLPAAPMTAEDACGGFEAGKAPAALTRRVGKSVEELRWQI